MNDPELPTPARSAEAGRSPLPRWQRRARPLLGTLVEVGLDAAEGGAADAAFAAVAAVQACLSRFEPGSDVGRFNAMDVDACVDVQADTAAVLELAQRLFDDTGGRFDVALGSGRWSLCGRRLVKHDAGARIDLGGIGKGHAVDRAVAALRAAGVGRGWVNAGGDVRVFGDTELPLKLRDERAGGVTDFGLLHDGAFATSCFDAPGHARLARAVTPPMPSHHGAASRQPQRQPQPPERATPCHVSVAAPSCILADALTKVVALSGDAMHPLLARHGAQAWLHPQAGGQPA